MPNPIINISTKTSMEWKVENFLELPWSEEIYDNYFDSSIFTSFCRLRIYPNCKRYHELYYEDGIHWIGLYLIKEGSGKEPSVDFRIGIKKSDGSVFQYLDNELLYNIAEDRWEGVFYIQRSALLVTKGALAEDGSLTVFCTLCNPHPIVNNVSSQTSASDDIHTLSKDLKHLYLDGQYSDITIKVKSKEFTAHKCILASRSNVFAAMFQDGFREKSSGSVTIDDSDPGSFEQLLLYLYTGSLDVVNSTNAVSLYVTADKYDVNELKEECSRNMTRELSVDSFCDVVCLATTHNETGLLTAATTFFINNMKTILQTSKWQGFLAEHPTLGNELFLKSLDKPDKI